MQATGLSEKRLKMNHQDNDQLLEAASELAYAAIERADGDLTQMPQPLQTVFCVYHATGIIDNGGFLYFFDSDFPCHPPYAFFIEAYRSIGCGQQADALQAAVDSFGLPDPEKQVNLRQDFMETHFDDKSQTVAPWNDNICGNDDVWNSLAEWIRTQPDLTRLLQQ